MDLSRTPLYSMMSRRMGWLTERQRVLAENIANADTPGFQARDLRPLDFRRELAQSASRLAPVATNGSHIVPTGPNGGQRAERVRSSETTLSGNTVSLEREMMRAGETANEHQLVSTLYRRQLGMLRSVLGRTGG